jgi:hypothetical protein
VKQLAKLWKVIGPHDADTVFRLAVVEEGLCPQHVRRSTWLKMCLRGLEEASIEKQEDTMFTSRLSQDIRDMPYDVVTTFFRQSHNDDHIENCHLPLKDPTLVLRPSRRHPSRPAFVDWKSSSVTLTIGNLSTFETLAFSPKTSESATTSHDYH